ncbi:MAG: helix-turn-helix domain-containing protein [Clostridiales bacterium]|nr:helix-turn-helix domain-containing protein [Clostridiales bacterium]
MSELLRISPRSYSDLENGKYMCSAMVLIYFILYCDIDANDFFGRLKDFLENRE